MGFLSEFVQLSGQQIFYIFYRLDAGRNETGVEMAIRFLTHSGEHMRSLLLASLFVSASAMACPDLSGTYAACIQQSNGTVTDTDMVISQAVQSGVTVYTTTATDAESGERSTDEIVTSGVPTTMTDEFGITMTSRASCVGDTVVMSLNFQYQGQDLGTANLETKKEGNTLVSRTTGTLNGESIEDVSICE